MSLMDTAGGSFVVAAEKFVEGLDRVAKENKSKKVPVQISASFLCYRLRLYPFLVADNLSQIVEKGVATFNERHHGYAFDIEVDGDDFILTLRSAPYFAI